MSPRSQSPFPMRNLPAALTFPLEALYLLWDAVPLGRSVFGSRFARVIFANRTAARLFQRKPEDCPHHTLSISWDRRSNYTIHCDRRVCGKCRDVQVPIRWGDLDG